MFSEQRGRHDTYVQHSNLWMVKLRLKKAEAEGVGLLVVIHLLL